MKNLYKIEAELYIISDTENVNENCWIITDGKLVQVSYLLSNEVARGYKVILTTNKLLIKDGVQAIDDEFLEWFVNNPSCEKVDTFKYPDFPYIKHKDYKIIIPKEEPKQGIDKIENDFLECLSNSKVVYEPKQETLEEAFKRIKEIKTNLDFGSFHLGYKLAQERSYSEEEVKPMFNRYNEFISHHDIEEWQPWIDKQFKKK